MPSIETLSILKRARLLVALVAIVGCQAASAGLVAVSNLDYDVSTAIQPFTQEGLAFEFRTPDTGSDQILSSVTIRTFATGSDVGTSVQLSLWDPRLKFHLVDFDDVILQKGFDIDLTVFAQNEFTLEADLPYWLVATTSADRHFSGWVYTHDKSETGLPGWTIDDASSVLAESPTNCQTQPLGCNINLHTDVNGALMASISVVPEPSSLALLGIGAVLATAARRRRSQDRRLG